MRDKKPFGFFGYGQNFLEINSKLTLRGADGSAVYEAPFLFHDKFESFVPQFAPFQWNDVKEIEVLTEVEYKIVAITVDMDHLGFGAGHYKFTNTWDVKYGRDGIVLHSGRMKDLGSKGDGDFAVQIQIQASEPALESDSARAILMLRLACGGKDDGKNGPILCASGPANLPKRSGPVRVPSR